MPKSLTFVRMQTSFKGLMARAVMEFDRYAGSTDQFRWAFIEDPEMVARMLEVLAEDLPEEDLAQVVARLPYLFLLFRKADDTGDIPVEATLAFLSVVNRSGMITIMRQVSDRDHLAPFCNLSPGTWLPLLFMVGGVPDLDHAFVSTLPKHCTHIGAV